MASIIFNSCLDDVNNGNIDFGSDNFKGLLVLAAYTPNKDTHLKRSDVTNEVAAGSGYSTGGAATTVTVTKDTANDRVDVAFGAVAWAASTITARGMVIYKSRGGLASADELVCYIDFGADISSTNDTFTATPSSPLRYQN